MLHREAVSSAVARDVCTVHQLLMTLAPYAQCSAYMLAYLQPSHKVDRPSMSAEDRA